MLSTLRLNWVSPWFPIVIACTSCSDSGENDPTESTPAESLADDDAASDGGDAESADANDDTPSGDDPPGPTSDDDTLEEPEVRVPPNGDDDVAEPEPLVAPEPVDTPEPVPPPPTVSPTPPPTITPVATEPACGELCGNGVVDSCEVCPPGATGTPLPAGAAARVPPCDDLGSFPCNPVPVCTTQAEQCDGATPQSCVDVGFADGPLDCTASCTFDQSACRSCSADERVLACDDRVADVDGATVVALATSDASIGVAWSSSAGVEFATFGGDLALLERTGILAGQAPTLALTTLPSGWLLAAGANLMVLDDSGGIVSQRGKDGLTISFASTGSETPLVVWSSGVATLLDENGDEVWQTALADNPIESHYGSAVATEGGFLVALRSSNGVEVFHLDGQTGEILDVSAPGGTSTEYPQLASDGTAARAVWADFSATPSVYFAALDARGQRVGEPVLLGGSPDYFNRSPVAMLGEDAVVLFGGYTGATGQGQALHLRRVDASGTTLWGDLKLQADPNSVSWPRLAPFGDEFVVAWVAGGQPGRVGLAKFTP